MVMLHKEYIKIAVKHPSKISRRSSGEFIHDIVWLECKIILIINSDNRHSNYIIFHNKVTAVI